MVSLYVFVLAIFVGYILWYRGLRRLQPSQVAVYVYLVPFFGVLSAWLLLDETITGWLLLGGATILTGVIVTNSGRRPAAVPEAPATRRDSVSDLSLRNTSNAQEGGLDV